MGERGIISERGILSSSIIKKSKPHSSPELKQGIVRGLPISNSDSGHTTPTVTAQLRLRSRNSDYVYGSPPRRLPRCARLAQLLYSHFSRIPSIHSCHP